MEYYLRPIHFQNMGKLLVTMSLLWGYFVFNERLTVWYGNESHETGVFWATQAGDYAPFFWTMVIVNFVVPIVLVGIRRFRTITGTVIASCGVVVGMWLERFLIIIPSLSYKQLSYMWGSYAPTWAELTIMAATFAGIALLFLLFSKFVPIISIWELKVGNQPKIETDQPLADSEAEGELA